MESRGVTVKSYVRLTILLTALSGVLWLFSQAVTAEENEQATETRCLNLARIQDIDIIDDRTLLFNMSDNRMYANELPHRCFGLRRDSALLYRVRMNQLCDLDTITILNSFGRGFMPEGTCGLGKFSLLSEQQAEALKNARD